MKAMCVVSDDNGNPICTIRTSTDLEPTVVKNIIEGNSIEFEKCVLNTLEFTRLNNVFRSLVRDI